MWSKVKIFGHPVHPMLVAYPIAFYTSTLVSFIVYAVTNDLFWLNLGIAVNLAGVVMAAVAAVPGFVDWAVGIPRDAKAKRIGLIHMSLNVGSLVLFLINLLVYFDNWNGPKVGAATGIILSLIGVGLTVAAGFFGWSLVQDHHVGVRLTGEQATIDRQSGTRGMRRAS